MANIFVSYTSSDRDWAYWIGQELQKLGHEPHIHEWEISAGGSIPAWMTERLQNADRVLCVVSAVYLTKDYSAWELQVAQWAAASKRPNFLLPVFVDCCEAPIAMAHIKRCDLFGLNEDEARARLAGYLTPAARPKGPAHFPGAGSSALAHFPGKADPQKSSVSRAVADAQQGARVAASNIPIGVPRHFVGRGDELAAIGAALERNAIAALHGLRGVGKTTLAAAYAELHRADFRATWWIRAQTEATMRADMAALGVRMGWVAADEKEEPALEAVRERLRQEGDGILLVLDNAIDAASLEPYLPLGGAARVLVTSNNHALRSIAHPIEIRIWPKEVGADYLAARSGRRSERADAEALSLALGGLPLAHEQAAAYCERLDVSLAEYRERFEASPARLLDAASDAPKKYGLTVAKTFALAIDEAAQLHPAAEPMIVHAALLAPEPIPLFLFSEGREKFGKALGSLLAGDGLDEAVAALRAFALVDRETIVDERDTGIATKTIRLHRLVREVAAGRCDATARKAARLALTEVMAEVYPTAVFDDPSSWPRARRLDALALDLIGDRVPAPPEAQASVSVLLNLLASYRLSALAAYSQARPLFERALAIREEAFGPDHTLTAESLNNLAGLLFRAGDLAGARPLFLRAMKICSNELGPEHPFTVASLNNYALLLLYLGQHARARPLFEQALAIREKTRGAEDPFTAQSLNNLALSIHAAGDFAGARSLHERALAIREKALGPNHTETSESLHNFAALLHAQADLAGALRLYERALAIREKELGAEHPSTKSSARGAAGALDALRRADEAAAVRTRYGLDRQE